MTPEQALNRLIEAIDYELDHYGPSSLADVIASVVSARHDDDEPRPTDAAWIAVMKEYEALAHRLVQPPCNVLHVRRTP